MVEKKTEFSIRGNNDLLFPSNLDMPIELDFLIVFREN